MSDSVTPPATHSEHSAVIAGLVAELVSTPADDRFAMFYEICWHTCVAYSDVMPPVRFADGIDDPAVYKELLANPVAGPLLAYFVHALMTYDLDPAELPKKSTTERRSALAKAMSLTGKQGKHQLSTIEHSLIALWFSSALTRIAKARDSAGTTANKRREQQEALKAVYRAHYEQPYDPNHDTHKTRMAELRKSLRQWSDEFDL